MEYYNKGLYGVMKFPLSIMVWVGLTVNGSTIPYFVEKGLYKIKFK